MPRRRLGTETSLVEPNANVESEFYGGEQLNDPEDEDIILAWRPEQCFDHNKLVNILSRSDEITAAGRKGRKKAANVQMKMFDDRFHTVLNTPVPANSVNLQEKQFSYVRAQSVNNALQYQDAVVKQMKAVQLDGKSISQDTDDDIEQIVLHNLSTEQRSAEWIELADALKGPAHVARMLIKKLQDTRSKPGKPYRLNAEQLECIALYVAALEKPFAQRPDKAKPWLHPATVLMTIIMDGGGGCGKTTLATEVILPLLETYYHPEGVLRRAPSNKPARIIGGRTMHSGQGLTPENSMRTAALALNPQSRQKLNLTHADAGVLYIDESSQLQGELNHAGALRTTYARESKYKLNRNIYSSPAERFGRIAFLIYSQDHLQLPPVPASSSMLAPLEGTSDEHKVGAKIFRNAELVFRFNVRVCQIGWARQPWAGPPPPNPSL